MMRNYDNCESKLPATHCALCMQIYDKPTVLMCGHSWCAGCIQLLIVRKADLMTVTCPQCRTVTSIKAEALPLNYGMVELMDMVETLQQQRQQQQGAGEESASPYDQYTHSIEDHGQHTNTNSTTIIGNTANASGGLLATPQHSPQQHNGYGYVTQNGYPWSAQQNGVFGYATQTGSDSPASALQNGLMYAPPQNGPFPAIHTAYDYTLNHSSLAGNDNEPQAYIPADKLVIRKQDRNKLLHKTVIDMPLSNTVDDLVSRLMSDPILKFQPSRHKLIWNGHVINRMDSVQLKLMGVKRGDTMEMQLGNHRRKPARSFLDKLEAKP